MKSRVECTKAICAYIKPEDGSRNLQNEKDRKIIIPDAKLTKLLGYNPETHGPLKYPTIQKLIQGHFVDKGTPAVKPKATPKTKKVVEQEDDEYYDDSFEH